MKSMNQKRWLALAFLCLAPISAFAGQEKPKPRNHHERPANERTVQVPEGGSALVYLLGAGVTCMGAMLIRSRSDNRENHSSEA
jgi:hypothetical protein